MASELENLLTKPKSTKSPVTGGRMLVVVSIVIAAVVVYLWTAGWQAQIGP